MSHALIRTSPKGRGQEFIGICYKCGRANLPIEGASWDCPEDEEVSDSDALIQILEVY